jgi:hypothetical protein
VGLSIDQRQTDDRNRREVSDQKRCHRYLHFATWNDAAKAEEKLCPTSHQRLREKWNYSRPQVAKRNPHEHTPSPYVPML